MFLYTATIGDELVLMDDNARPHSVHPVDNFHFDEGILRLDSPACSPDIDDIERGWDVLGRTVVSGSSLPGIIQQLEISLLQEWNKLYFRKCMIFYRRFAVVFKSE